MKFFLPIIFLLLSQNLFSQKLQVESKVMKNEEGFAVDSWVAHIEQDIPFAMTTLNAFLKKTFSVKGIRKSKTLIKVERTTFSEISNLRVDMRAMFGLESGGTAIAFMFSPGYDIHFGPTNYPTEYQKAEEFTKNFVRFHYKYFYDEKTKKLSEKIKDLQEDILSNDKKTEKNNGYIRDYETKMTATDSNVEKLRLKKSKLEATNQKIAADTQKKKDEITKAEEELVNISGGIKNVTDFK